MEDFPFSFGNASDEDETSEGLFCAPKAKTNSAKIKAPIEQDPYYAQIDEDGWFHHTGKSIQELMLQDKNGATKVKMRADQYYMLRQYQEAYDIAQEYCQIVASNDTGATSGADGGAGVLKVADSKEMQEMALRCAMKLEMFNEAAELADGLILQDTGVVFLKAKAYMAVGRFNDAAERLVQYQKSRSSNYSVWRALAECLHQSVISVKQASARTPELSLDSLSLSTSEPRMGNILALISVLRARHLMGVSSWSQVDYAQTRYCQEMKIIEHLRSVLERECGLDTNKVTDQIRRTDKSLDEVELQYELLEYGSKVVGPAQETLRKMKGSGEQQLSKENGSFSQEIVEFVVGSWDPQLLETSATGVAAESGDDAVEGTVRNK
ncbi:hypothetical protein EDD21DRAFT_442208 [Dissophora ornata]|nr:hypothetical protein EDD21DRAFT_442208 [Dissophora ornata]